MEGILHQLLGRRSYIFSIRFHCIAGALKRRPKRIFSWKPGEKEVEHESPHFIPPTKIFSHFLQPQILTLPEVLTFSHLKIDGFSRRWSFLEMGPQPGGCLQLSVGGSSQISKWWITMVGKPPKWPNFMAPINGGDPVPTKTIPGSPSSKLAVGEPLEVYPRKPWSCWSQWVPKLYSRALPPWTKPSLPANEVNYGGKEGGEKLGKKSSWV